jgi:hypothetical protein
MTIDCHPLQSHCEHLPFHFVERQDTHQYSEILIDSPEIKQTQLDVAPRDSQQRNEFHWWH